MAQTYVMGKEFSLSYSGKTIGYCTDFDFDISKDTEEVSHLGSEGWKEFFTSGMKEWSISFNGLVTKGTLESGKTDYDNLLESLEDNDNSVTIVITSPTGLSTQTGQAFLTNLKMSVVQGVITYSGSLQGTGEIVPS